MAPNVNTSDKQSLCFEECNIFVDKRAAFSQRMCDVTGSSDLGDSDHQRPQIPLISDDSNSSRKSNRPPQNPTIESTIEESFQQVQCDTSSRKTPDHFRQSSTSNLPCITRTMPLHGPSEFYQTSVTKLITFIEAFSKTPIWKIHSANGFQRIRDEIKDNDDSEVDEKDSKDHPSHNNSCSDVLKIPGDSQNVLEVLDITLQKEFQQIFLSWKDRKKNLDSSNQYEIESSISSGSKIDISYSDSKDVDNADYECLPVDPNDNVIHLYDESRISLDTTSSELNFILRSEAIRAVSEKMVHGSTNKKTRSIFRRLKKNEQIPLFDLDDASKFGPGFAHGGTKNKNVNADLGFNCSGFGLFENVFQCFNLDSDK